MASTGLTKQLALSPEFKIFMGKPTASRGEVTTALWKHIREQKLKNPETGVFEFDEVLQELLNARSIKRTSEMLKLVKDAGAFVK